MMPKDVMKTSVPELLSFINGYHRRLKISWEQTRLLAYSIYAVVTDENKRQEIEDWMPMWFDPSPEERAAKGKVEMAKQGMVADHLLEEYRKLGIDI